MNKTKKKQIQVLPSDPTLRIEKPNLVMAPPRPQDEEDDPRLGPPDESTSCSDPPCQPPVDGGLRVLTIEETAALLNVSKNTVRNQISAGKLPAFSIGRCIRILYSDIDTLIRTARQSKVQGPKEKLCHFGNVMASGKSISKSRMAQGLDDQLERLIGKKHNKSMIKSKPPVGMSNTVEK